MPDTKITALTALTTADPATDMFPVVDVSDTTMAASGTTKRISINNILACSPTATLASATITGDLTVRTNAISATSTGVGFGITTAAAAIDVVSSFQWRSNVAGADKLAMFSGGAGLIYLGSTTASALGFLYNGSEAMRLNSTGLGVQVTPSAPLCIKTRNSDSVGLRVLQSTGGTAGIQFTDDPVTADWGSILATSANVILRSNSFLQFQTGGATERMRIDSSGNVGVGVSPSAWAVSYKSVQVGTIGSFAADPANVSVGSNRFFNGTNSIYLTTAASTVYNQNAGQHQWFNAPSGTAGNAITFTQAMTLDASGNLLVGTSGISWQTVAGFYYFAGSSLNITRNGDACQLLNRLTSDGIIVDLRRSANAVGNISVTTTGATFNSTSDYRLKESVAPLSGGLSRVNSLKPSVYKWKSNGSDGEGFLAHELAEVVPAAVNGEKDAVNEDGTIKAQSIDMSRIVPILVAAIKELSAEVNALKNA